jgi:predicted nucleic acid-binding protein
MAIKPCAYVDSGSIIDAVKKDVGVLPTDREADVWYLKKLLTAAKNGDVILYTSFLSTAECVAIEMGQSQVPQAAQDAFKRLLLSGQYFRLVTPTPQTSITVQEFRWKHGLVIGGADAIHLASALETNCQEFISTDERLKKPKIQAAKEAINSLRLIRGAQTQVLPASYLQGNMLDESGKTH